MHDEIIRYHISGVVDEASLEQTKQRLVEFLESHMKDEGCVPSLDLDPGFTIDYDAEADRFNFELSVYGIYVGQEGDLWDFAGMTGGRMIRKHSLSPRQQVS